MPFPTTNATRELPAINQILASVGQAPVTTLDQTNPDVAIAYDTLLQVSREVQAEGWTFNTELNYEDKTDGNKEYIIRNNMLQVDLSASDNSYSTKNLVRRTPDGSLDSKLYDKYNHTYKLTDDANSEIILDIIWLYDWVDLPIPIQDYIVSRAAAIVSSRIVGDSQQYQLLAVKEQQTRATAMEYECNQGDYTFFGHPVDKNKYKSYQPYHALSR
tara:strand:- start:201 stop:848 length:648 start_codon:yes stop_codon:yes gene_type:complete